MVRLEYINKTLRVTANRPANISFTFAVREERLYASFRFEEPGTQETFFPLDNKNYNLLICVDNRLEIATSLSGLPLRIDELTD